MVTAAFTAASKCVCVYIYIYMCCNMTAPPHTEEGVGDFKEVLLIKDIDYSKDLLLLLSFCLNLYSCIVVFGRMKIYIIRFFKSVIL